MMLSNSDARRLRMMLDAYQKAKGERECISTATARQTDPQLNAHNHGMDENRNHARS